MSLVKERFDIKLDSTLSLICYVLISESDYKLIVPPSNPNCPEILGCTMFNGFSVERSMVDSHPPCLRVREFTHLKEYLAEIAPLNEEVRS